MATNFEWLPSLILISTLYTTCKVFRFLTRRRRTGLRSVAVLVLGDIGRSPRMMYHAQSFANSDFQVYFIGYRGSRPIPSLAILPQVQFVYLPDPLTLRPLPFVVLAPLKIVHQIICVILALYKSIPLPPEYIIVQNPPSIPALALVRLFAATQGTKVIIDWHNLGYSILAMKLGDSHFFVSLAKRFEQFFGKSAYAHLFVTDAMKNFLTKEWALQGEKRVLHDRPPSHFRPSTPGELHELFPRLLKGLDVQSLQDFWPAYEFPLSSPFSEVTSRVNTPVVGGPLDDLPQTRYSMPQLREDRPALLVSSTSWTADEDFSILIEALRLYEASARVASAGLPKVLCLITGKGPLQKSYMGQVKKLQVDEKWEYVRCDSVWLEPEDYPLLLGSADIGISLHSSSSALDLPMKVVDMFGCGLPVCALDFACIDELVKEGLNGHIFKDAEELNQHIRHLLSDFPRSSALRTLRNSLERAVDHTGGVEHLHAGSWTWGSWEENWGRVVRPLVSPYYAT